MYCYMHTYVYNLKFECVASHTSSVLLSENLKLGFDFLPIVEKFVGDVERFVQHSIWLWPPSKFPASIQ